MQDAVEREDLQVREFKRDSKQLFFVCRNEREFSNYEITVEWHWPPGKKPGNSGILVHTSKPRERFVWPESLEVQLVSSNAGDFWMISETITVADSTQTDRRRMKLRASSENVPGE